MMLLKFGSRAPLKTEDQELRHNPEPKNDPEDVFEPDSGL
jgi:hypothetical protein